MSYTDKQELQGLFAHACLQHGLFSEYETSIRRRWCNPYTSVVLTPNDQSRAQAYKKAVESIYELATRYYEQCREDWEVWQPLSSTRIESGLARLEEAVASQNEATFTQALTQIDWDNRPAEDYIRAIDLALQVGAHLAARRLAMEGAEFHFDSEELQKYARILAPPTIIKERPSNDVKPRANVEWLKTNRDNYRGQWVALKNGTLVASAKTHDELIAAVGSTKGSGILITNLY